MANSDNKSKQEAAEHATAPENSALAGALSYTGAAARALAASELLPGIAGLSKRTVVTPEPLSDLADLLSSKALTPTSFDGLPTTLPAPLSDLVGSIQDTKSSNDQPVSSTVELGRLVRQAREAMGLSQQKFADLAGVGRRFISELENGKGSVEFDKAMKAARAAGLTMFARSADVARP